MAGSTQCLALVMNRFPEHRESLERLYLKSESFQSLCDDYQECLAAIEGWSWSPVQEAAIYREELTALVRDLEEEILGYVEKGGGLFDCLTQETEC